MKKLTILSLATALVPAGLAAQTVTPPVPWQDVPDARLAVPGKPAPPPPVPAVTWQQPAPTVRVQTGTPPVVPPPPAVPPPPVVGTAPMAPPRHVRPRTHPTPAPVVVQRHRERVDHRGPGRHHRFQHIQRINRGGFLHHGWFGPQFHVRNWGLYGFPQPYRDRRWIRYYDDALLVDREGMVHDGRYGLDWDRYGEPWRYDRGVPEYVGDGDFHPAPEDYAYVEGYDERNAEGHPGEVVYGGGCHPAPAHGCGGYGYGYFYPAYGYGTVTITETTVTTTGHTVYEKAKAKPRRIKKKVDKRPPYGGGENG